MWKKLCLAFALFEAVVSFPVANLTLKPHPPTKPLNDVYEITLLQTEVPTCTLKLTDEQLKSGLVPERYRWRNGFYVHPDIAFTQAEYDIINAALWDLQSVLCIPVYIWPPTSAPTGDYVHVLKGASGSGCWAYSGRLGGRQELNLAVNNCINRGTATHELIHALGFKHEHQRMDRDNFVNIFLGNVQPGHEHNFDIWSPSETFDLPYDHYSIMHYQSTAFSANGLHTILGKDGSVIPRNTVMTAYDTLKLQRMYNCIKE